MERLLRLENNVKQFKLELSKISWYMRGGVTYSELLDRYSHDDRESFLETINENIKNVKDTGMPLL